MPLVEEGWDWRDWFRPGWRRWAVQDSAGARYWPVLPTPSRCAGRNCSRSLQQLRSGHYIRNKPGNPATWASTGVFGGRLGSGARGNDIISATPLARPSYWLNRAGRDRAVEADVPENVPAEAYAGWVALVELVAQANQQLGGAVSVVLQRNPILSVPAIGAAGVGRHYDTFVVVVQAIQRGELREPERLMGFVRTKLLR